MTVKRDLRLVWLSMIQSFRKLPRGFWLSWLLFAIVSAAIAAPFDDSLFHLVLRDSPEGSGRIAGFLSQAGKFEHLNLIGTIILLGLAYWRNDRRLRRIAMSFFIASALAGLTVQVVKPLVGRPRPSECIREHIGDFDLRGPTFKRGFNSYPSGHTTTTVAAAAVVAIAFPRLIIPCVLAALAMAWARVYGKNHFPIDTMHGAILGYLYAYVCTRWLKRRKRNPYAMRRQPIRVNHPGKLSA